MMSKLPELPLGVTSLGIMRSDNYIYVDKTRILAKLISKRGPFFLSRPRRFGKSTLVDTLANLFNGNAQLFKDTYIGCQHLYPTSQYKIIRLDFSDIQAKLNKSFEKRFLTLLRNTFNVAGIDNDEYHEDDSASDYFSSVLTRFSLNNLVLLIDEYDAPLTAVLNDKFEFELRKEILSDFYAGIKKNADKFKFTFITGVTKYSHLSIFSAFNNLIDLSLDPEYGAITGYTQAELEHYFKPYLEHAVQILNQKHHQGYCTYTGLIEKLKQNYDGYSFDRECLEHVYNPWSILNFLNAPHNGFLPYWSDTGGAKPALLVQYLNKTDAISKEQNFERFLDLNYEYKIKPGDLSPPLESIDSKEFGLLPILYQAGYFCIKQGMQFNNIAIGIPNLEIKQAFAEIVIDSLARKVSASFAHTLSSNLMHYFIAGQTAEIKESLNKLINSLSYQGIAKFNEAAYRDFLATVLLFAGASNIVKEHVNAQGRADLTFEADQYAVVCELKVVHHEKNIYEMAGQAKLQIRNRKYDRLPTNKEVICYAMVILHQSGSDKQSARFEIVSIEKL